MDTIFEGSRVAISAYLNKRRAWAHNCVLVSLSFPAELLRPTCAFLASGFLEPRSVSLATLSMISELCLARSMAVQPALGQRLFWSERSQRLVPFLRLLSKA